MNPKVLAQIIVQFVEDKPAVSKISKPDLPAATMVALKSWAGNLNLPTEDPETSEDLFEIKTAGFDPIYLADYSGDDPDPFRAVCVILDNAVIGESVDVGS